MAPNWPRTDCRSRTNGLLLSLNRLRTSSAFELVRGRTRELQFGFARSYSQACGNCTKPAAHKSNSTHPHHSPDIETRPTNV
jgi:hypothetical protein